MILEKSETLGSGAIGQYRITANSLGGVFLEKFQDKHDELSRYLRTTAQWRYFSERREEAVELRHVGRFLEQIGAFVQQHKTLYKRFEVSTLSTVEEIQLTGDGRYAVRYTVDGQTRQALCKKVMVNLGGQVNDMALPQLNAINSDAMLKGQYDKQIKAGRYQSIAIVGSSHSAVSCLIRLIEQLDFQGPIQLLVKRDFKLFFDSPQAALAQGYPFVDADVCQASQRVNRYSGLRYDSLTFARKIQRGEIPNLTVVNINADGPETLRMRLDLVDLAIKCTGFSATPVRLLDIDGSPISLRQDSHGLIVDHRLNPTTVSNQTLANFHAFGLGAGIKTGGDSGGEESFSGRIDGVWIYQHVVPRLIFH
ncbi:hypothetical protein PflQ2_1422 [Pseudomonas fluorescens Q2-87]|uniref:Pyridine nucleotide-disulfide oxidoreductase n=1 Tax=Pseudomonas fluorescens (strain Q2-87) TaxID=1038922 RepID=J2EK63_PSEFQ|nr:hypothetical protein PflQ2_1422 [Pseudomonas fluorescens Q2-87]